MREIAPDTWLLPSFPPHSYNAYVFDGVLLDARTSRHARGLQRQLRDVPLTLHVVSHAHSDHTGASAAICLARGIELWASQGDADAIEAGDWRRSAPKHLVNDLQARFTGGPGHPVARRLREGDTVGSFEVLETPGHSPGHISLWRERDRTLLAIDAIFNMNIATGRPGLREPPKVFTVDPKLNRDSMRKLAALRPAVCAFGHGPALTDPGRLADYVDRLPA